jgi:sugar phosphate isomerase/epimerase
MELSLVLSAGAPVRSIDDLDARFADVAAAGFRCVSLGLQDLEPALSEADGLPRVAALLASHGLRCSDVISLTIRRDEQDALASARRIAVVASALGTRDVLTLLYTRVSEESLARFARCAEIVSEAGARLALEFAPETPVSSIREALTVVDNAPAGTAGVMIDTWHFFRGPSTWDDLASIPLGHIAFVQFDDALPKSSDDLMYEAMQRRTWPGRGEFDLSRFAATLTARGWSGLVSAEVLSEDLRRLDTLSFAQQAYASLLPYWPAGAP